MTIYFEFFDHSDLGGLEKKLNSYTVANDIRKEQIIQIDYKVIPLIGLTARFYYSLMLVYEQLD